MEERNNLQVLEHKTEVIIKGTKEGTLLDGTLKGEAEVVLPSGRIVVGKIDRSLDLVSENNKIEGTWELANYASRSAQPQKLTLKLDGKKTNSENMQFDTQMDLTYMAINKEDMVLQLVAKKLHQDDKCTIIGQGSLTGSLVNTQYILR
ncbi:uncharacterized protein LOC124371706 [Homalodisca vitripennis]|uniref:uncharacterized protein LOC124371706 n=1 Tax=Homalodisca vitripennis TaxID=197043 RepID=UPI001EEC5DBF|nr:uncharacterized protein LOC124371706 [Homalodisca vitripennis]